VAVSFGCVEATLFIRRERGELVWLRAWLAGCEVCGKGNSLKLGKTAWSATSLVPDRCATRLMCARIPITSDATRPRNPSAIPLHVEGKLIGVFTASHPELDAFPAQQLRLLQSLCSYVAVAVHNARRFQEEQHQRQKMSREANEARKIQQALLPRSSPYIPGFAISGLSTPAGAVAETGTTSFLSTTAAGIGARRRLRKRHGRCAF